MRSHVAHIPQQHSLQYTAASSFSQFSHLGDHMGLLYFLGCGGGIKIYQNPALQGALAVSSSSVGYGKAEAVVHADRSEFCTESIAGSWISIDVRVPFIVSSYVLQHDKFDEEAHFIRSWQLLGRNYSTEEWIVLDHRLQDQTVHRAHPWGWFEVAAPAPPYRQFQLLQVDVNSDDTHHLMVSAVEFYGTLVAE